MEVNFDNIKELDDETLKKIVMKVTLEKGRRNKIREKKKQEKMADLIYELSNLFDRINTMWEVLDNTNFLDNNYPFENDFNELTFSVNDWSLKVSDHVESFGS